MRQRAVDAQMIDELKFFLGLGAITLAVIGLLIYFGLKLNKAVETQAPKINFPLKVTMTGTALWACVVGFWVICAVARELKPADFLGGFLHTTDGIASVFLGSIVFATIAGVVLEKLGYPIAKRGDQL
jgi:hypothetical protein